VSTVRADLARASERRHKLTITSPNQGVFILPEARSLPGQFIKQGALLGYIMGTSESNVVVVVNQSDIALVRKRTKGVELRLAGDLDTPLTVAIDRATPAASDYLPSPVLGTTGGGDIPVNPADPRGTQTLTKTFQFEIKLAIDQKKIRIGERVYALFDHGYEPLALQWYRSLRQLFLRQFHV
jgi:putative peptide zinc metalloprotease protein